MTGVRQQRPWRKRQSGGTVLGLIIGVVVGLAAALAVAVYVTKVPNPFVNKVQGRSADQDAAEAQKNKDWDPNAPLYGKNPARPAVPQSLPGAASASAAARPDSGLSTAPAALSANAAPALRGDATSDPLGDLARVRSSSGGSDPFTYYVQVGAYRTSEDAEGQRAKLLLSGIEARVTEREQSGRVVFRVRVGPFERKDEADKAKERLEAAGLETALVRVQR